MNNLLGLDLNSGGKSVVWAFIGNVFVTAIKVIAAVITGSTSMYAESIHSFADTLNQSLLLIGIKRSRRPADNVRGYGYGIERFFWSLISACGILFVGAGITILHSLESLGTKTSHEFNLISIIVLVIAFVIEGGTLYAAVREISSGKKLSKQIFKDADPVTLAVVYEDGAAVLGVLIAFAAQVASYLTGNSIYDVLGGLAIGIILGFLAIVLIIKNYPYIIGKPLDNQIKEDIIYYLEEDPCIEKVIDFKSEAVDLGKYRIFATVEWNGTPLYKRIYHKGELEDEYNDIKDDFQNFAKLMFDTADRIPRLVGSHIDIIEKRIMEKFPQVIYIDIEIN